MRLKRKLYSTRFARNLAGFGKKILRKPPMKAKRDAIKVSRTIEGVKNTGMEKLIQINTNPGKLTSDVVESALKNPLTAASVPTPLPTTLVAAGETALRSKVPIYRKVTDVASKTYRNSPIPKVVESGVNNVLSSARAFSIPEGHYTGEKVSRPMTTSEALGKGLWYGLGAGALVGAVDDNNSISGGATKGAKLGIVSSLVMKSTLDKMHSPMTRIKFNKVDRLLRREFSKFKSSYIIDGSDNKNKKLRIEDVIVLNDLENLLRYRINISVQDNKITLYTINLTDQELDITSNLLDSYCKKYFGMKYSSSAINAKENSYSVVIVFTNYENIVSFILNLSRALNCKINLINNKVDFFTIDDPLVAEERNFSNTLTKSDLISILIKGASNLGFLRNFKKSTLMSASIMSLLLASIDTFSKKELVNLKAISPRDDFNNSYLLNTLTKLRYIKRFDYTVGEKNSPFNLSMVSGRFLITCVKGEEISKAIDESVWKKFKKVLVKSEVRGVNVYTYLINSRSEFETLLKILMSLNKKPNVFE